MPTLAPDSEIPTALNEVLRGQPQGLPDALISKLTCYSTFSEDLHVLFRQREDRQKQNCDFRSGKTDSQDSKGNDIDEAVIQALLCASKEL